MEKWIKEIEFIIMPSSHPLGGHEDRYEAAYRCWREAWTKFMREVGATDSLHSDAFIIPDEMGVIFYKGECVGMACYTYGSLNGPLRDHSWFEAWDELSIGRLKRLSSEVVICTQFTVGPAFTGKGHIVRWKEIASLYTLLRFLHSSSDVMAGQLNVLRKVETVGGENAGATIIHPDYTIHFHGLNLQAQLVAYERNKVLQTLKDRNLMNLCVDLWSRTTHLTEYPANKVQLKKAA